MTEQQIETFSKFGKTFQEKLVKTILFDRNFANQMEEVLDTNYLELKYLQVFVSLLFQHRQDFPHPTYDTMVSVIRTQTEDYSASVVKQVIDFLARIKSGSITDEGQEYVKEKSLDFCKKQKLKEAILRSVGLLKTQSFDQIQKTINDAMSLGADNDHGHDYHKDAEDRFELKMRSPVPTNWEEIDKITKGGLGKRELGVVVAPTGCHAKGTLVLSSSGKMIKVEDVALGDQLAGVGGPTTVLNLHRGNETMYRIVPTKGEPFVVNEGHILSLKRTNDGTSKAGTVINISVGEYLRKSSTFKHIHKLYRSAVAQFAGEEEVESPYFVGLMLGDGSTASGNIRFTNNDQVLLDAVVSEAQRRGMTVREYKKSAGTATDLALVDLSSSRNSLADFFRGIGIYGLRSEDKRVPHSYKTSSRQSRLEILAGLLDTDGSCVRGVGFDYVSKSQQLSEDVAFIARSLGLAAYVSQCEKGCQGGFSGVYHRVSISGDCSIIPTRLERKQCLPRKQKKDVLVTGFSVEGLPADDYFGFEVDGDNLYLMGWRATQRQNGICRLPSVDFSHF